MVNRSENAVYISKIGLSVPNPDLAKNDQIHHSKRYFCSNEFLLFELTKITTKIATSIWINSWISSILDDRSISTCPFYIPKCISIHCSDSCPFQIFPAKFHFFCSGFVLTVDHIALLHCAMQAMCFLLHQLWPPLGLRTHPFSCTCQKLIIQLHRRPHGRVLQRKARRTWRRWISPLRRLKTRDFLRFFGDDLFCQALTAATVREEKATVRSSVGSIFETRTAVHDCRWNFHDIFGAASLCGGWPVECLYKVLGLGAFASSKSVIS